MRVLVLAAAVGDLTPARAGAVVGSAWARLGHGVAVVPMSTDGPGLDAAVAGVGGASGAVVVRQSGGPTTRPLGEAVTEAVAAGATTVLLDLTGPVPPDGGAGLLAALGATADAPLDAGAEAWAGIGEVRLPAPPARLVAVAAPGQEESPLLGVRGVAGRTGFEEGWDRARVLQLDAALMALTTALGLPHPPPGSGAGGGAALAVLALGGSVRTPASALADLVDLPRSLAVADLVVLVADRLDFGGAGVSLAQTAAGWAAGAGIPCVVVALQVHISSRELRILGVESAYGTEPGDAESMSPGPAESLLPGLAERVARTWSW